jgi:uncharacterized protein GlcG (DUF336 family)
MRNGVTRGGVIAFMLLARSLNADAQDATFTLRYLTPETALKAAQKALETCRANGYQVAVAVADRAGTTQVLLRDRFAGPHTVDVSVNKAWTALTFRLDTLSLRRASEPDGPAAPIRHFPRVVVMGGGIPIEAGGYLLGAIAVSGAPGGEADDACAKAGIEAIRSDIEF